MELAASHSTVSLGHCCPPASILKDPCDYMGPTQMMQDQLISIINTVWLDPGSAAAGVSTVEVLLKGSFIPRGGCGNQSFKG